MLIILNEKQIKKDRESRRMVKFKKIPEMFIIIVILNFLFVLSYILWSKNFSYAETLINVTACGELNQTGATYVLQNDVASDGTCFYVTQSNITLDLNGHTVTYDNMAPVLIPNGSFETDLADTWDLSHAPDASRAEGTFVNPVTVWDGSYALKFSTPAQDQYLTSVGSITLPANTTVAIWMMVRNLVSDNIVMSMELVGADGGAIASKTGRLWRGFSPVFMHYKTGANPETYQIKISMSGAGGAPSGAVYVDDVKIGRYRSHGIALGATNETYANVPRCPDCEVFSSVWRPNMSVKNGALKQGADAGFDCWAIWMGANAAQLSGGHIIENISGDINGPDSKFFYTAGSLYNSEIRGNTIRDPNKILTSRDNYTGTIIFINGNSSTYSKIHDNIIESGPHCAIFAGSNGSANAVEIYNNNITLQTFHTNDFAITGGGNKVYNNTLNCASGVNSCRGIAAGGSGTIVHDNTINVQQLFRNQEYNGCQGGNFIGAYGIQVEYDAKNVEIYNNTVNAYAGECPATALRTNINSAAMNIYIHDNIFNSISTHQYSNGRAIAFKLSGPATGPVSDPTSVYRVQNNIFNTNDMWIQVDSNTEKGVVFEGNTWQTSGTRREPFYPLEKFYTGYPQEWIFKNNMYGAEDKDRFESAEFRDSLNGSMVSQASFYLSWDLSLDVRDHNDAFLTAADVAIKDKGGTLVYSGSTNESGQIIVNLKEFFDQGGQRTTYNPYSITVSKDNVKSEKEITIGESKTEKISLEINNDDTTLPTIKSFNMPESATSLVIPISSFAAVDNIGVAGYLLSESSLTPSTSAQGWTKNPPTSYTFSSDGEKILYAWVKDEAGNISENLSAHVVIINPSNISSGGNGNSGSGISNLNTSEKNDKDGKASSVKSNNLESIEKTVIPPTQFKAMATVEKIFLSWQNLPDNNFFKVLIVRKERAAPVSKNDGTVIYEGKGESYEDKNLQSKKYFYGIFSIDKNNNYSNITTISATPLAEKIINTSKSKTPLKIKSLYGQSKTVVESISLSEAGEVYNYNKFVLLDNTGKSLYLKVMFLNRKALSDRTKYAVARFINEGTETTKDLGAGERAGVLASYYQAFKELPEIESDWQDVIKIANGRWPIQKSESMEKETKEGIFLKVYKRAPDNDNAYDAAAIAIITYGLRPAARNAESEKAGIKIFKSIYSYNPTSASDWDIVRAIAYSGAKRKS